MIIDRIELYHVAMPLIEPWRTAYGEDHAVDSVLLRMVGGGHEGWSESAPFAAPCYSPEWAAGVFDLLERWLAPAVVGRDVTDGADLAEALVHFKANPFAKAAIDTAWHVLAATSAGVPLHRHLGATRDRVDVGADFGVAGSIDHLLASIDEAVASGFKRVKLKFRPGWEVDVVEQVRKAFPDLTMHIDCNSGYTLEATDMFRRLDRFQLSMIEQPLRHDDVVDHARLAAAIETPICLDETIISVERTRQAIDLGSCQWVNIKPARVGGLTTALAIHDMCREAGIGCWVGGMLESAVGSSICIALAMLDNFIYPADIFPTSRFYEQDLSDPPVVLDESSGTPSAIASDVAGIPARPVPERLERCLVRSAVVEKT